MEIKEVKIKMGKMLYNRSAISDTEWKLIEPHLTGQSGQHKNAAKDNRKIINAVVWILKTGLKWRNLLPGYEKWDDTPKI